MSKIEYVYLVCDYVCVLHLGICRPLVRQGMDVNQHERLSNFTLGQKLK